jgi:hypothetical protein
VSRGPAARTLELTDSFAEINAQYYDRGWTDGLPIVPPTEDAVAEMLRWTDRDPLDVLGVLPPRQGEATVQKVAVNAVMAGCLPRYLPTVIAAVLAVADPDFNPDGVQATTHPCAPLLILNGPIARELEVNSGYNCYGQGFRANATIGRALRLVLMNIGGGLPGTGDRSTQGSPAKFTYCVAEHEEANPWEPLHVERGYAPEVSTVTAIAAEGPHNIQDHDNVTGEGILLNIAGAMGQAGSNNIYRHGNPALSLGPEHAATIARDGFSKADVKRFLYERARYPIRLLAPEYQRRLLPFNGYDENDPGPDPRAAIMESPDNLVVIVAGGAGKHSCWHPTFGSYTQPVTVPVARADGTPLRSVEDVHRG